MCREEKILVRHNKVVNLKKKYRSSHPRCRSSHWRCSVRKGVLKNFANFTGKHLCWSLILWSCKPSACKFFKKRLQHKCFPVKFPKLLRIPILRNICKRLLLEVLYKKVVLKNFAILTEWKKPVIGVCEKAVLGGWYSCESDALPYWSPSLVKKVWLLKWVALSLRIIWDIFFWSWIVFWLRTILRELRVLNYLCWEMQVFYLNFSKAMTLHCSSFVYYSWKSLFLQNITEMC